MSKLSAQQLREYNFSKAIKEARQSLTGLEAEVNEQASEDLQKRGIVTTGLVLPSELIQAIAKGGVVPAEGEHAPTGILADLGVTILDSVREFELLHGAETSSKFLNQGDPAITPSTTGTVSKVTPRTILGSRIYKNSHLAQTASMAGVMQEIIDDIEATIAKEIFKEILAQPALTGFDSAAAAEAITWPNITALNAAVKVPRLNAARYILGGGLYASLEATPKATGSARMILEDEKISCYKAINVRDLLQAVSGKNQVIFGDFARAFVAIFSGVEIIVDPFKNSNTGETILTWNRRVDVDINPSGFKTIQNATA